MDKALFSFVDYSIENANINFTYADKELRSDFKLNGIFDGEKKEYVLNIIFNAKNGNDDDFITIKCSARFVFNDVDKLEDIPIYFYSNSIAIVYPYIRSFVSTLTIQSNKGLIILPTMNLMPLGEQLQQNTTEL